MRIPLFSKLTAKSRGRKVVRATAARAMRGADEEYYEAEPNMKLSHAFMVVLILHVVAVGGIYAFNKIKVQKSGDLLVNITDKISKVSGGAASAKSQPATAPSASAVAAAPSAEMVPSARLTSDDADEPLPAVVSNVPTGGPAIAAASTVAPAAEQTTPVVSASAVAAPAKTAVKSAEALQSKTAPKVETKAAAASGTYKVAKGDNPYTIAKKLGVRYQDLLKANGIDDPTKLQIGQVLKAPPKAN
ncbi:MAG: LysM peptidoglycan-binding domain-containing protein [Chthoniobacterales bacterium]|nr:LysM peptidoglycan-binding domain-containing protein [Chthoniobacterales bacterium]